ncbi:type II secretion system protein [Rheinheimera sediminis]|uniref:PilW family protein n=1 Tax=Rheinheimera sp. YQF-1 TaxID=2499626 RepID=UPI000FD78DC8|nr:type II secretion system protein [Rheinheimera sp. YQF-1]RVT45976.1 type II secretion system protein [Rheinheimera sp. YQF-1]
MLRAARGFSLVELILVIVLLGIVSTLSLSYLSGGAEMYAQSADRERLLSQSRFVIERLTRELRNALPNSVRISTDGLCVEFIPLKFAGRYTELPGVNAATALDMTFFSGQSSSQSAFSSLIAEGDFITVYPTQPEHYYSKDRTLELKGAIAADESSGQRVTLEFNSVTAAGFPQASPNQRFFVWSSPVRYCLLTESNSQTPNSYHIYRFSHYGVLAQEPQTTDLERESGSLMAIDLVFIPGQPLEPFTYSDGVLKRSSVVHVVLSFSSNFADDLFFNQEIHIPNVP